MLRDGVRKHVFRIFACVIWSILLTNIRVLFFVVVFPPEISEFFLPQHHIINPQESFKKKKMHSGQKIEITAETA